MKSIVVGNWKMNPPTMRDAKKLLSATRKAAEKAIGVSVIIAPPTVFLRDLRSEYKGSRISYGVQNAHFDASGAYTGEISLNQVKDAGAGYVLIGHAERRALGESNEDTRKKVIATVAAKLIPILCIGETSRGEHGEHFTFVKDQLRAGFADLQPAKISKVMIAYEPVWAIGASAAMKPRDMHEMAIFIRKSIVDMHGESGMSVKILYGGSVDATNAVDMLQNGDVNGLLVGRVSTDPTRLGVLFSAIARA